LFRRSRRAGLAFIAVAVAALAVAACGDSGASDQEIAQAEKAGREQRAEKEKERRIEREIRQLKKERQKEKRRERQRSPGPSPPPMPASTPSPELKDCGSGVSAGPTTSCPFALNVRAEYEYYIGSGSGYVEAYSEANNEWYSMYCTAAPHECTGAIDAAVYFP